MPGPSGQGNWMSVARTSIANMPPLYGGGFWVACMQLVAYYYACGALLHFIVPRVLNVKGIQAQKRKPGEVLRDALCSLGAHMPSPAAQRREAACRLRCFQHAAACTFAWRRREACPRCQAMLHAALCMLLHVNDGTPPASCRPIMHAHGRYGSLPFACAIQESRSKVCGILLKIEAAAKGRRRSHGAHVQQGGAGWCLRRRS